MKDRRFRWWMVWLLIGPITFVMSLDRTAIVVAAPVIQKEYGFSLVEMSLILTSFSWTYAFLQVPAGWLAERIGPRRALYWANLLWSILDRRYAGRIQPDVVRGDPRRAGGGPGG